MKISTGFDSPNQLPEPGSTGVRFDTYNKSQSEEVHAVQENLKVLSNDSPRLTLSLELDHWNEGLSEWTSSPKDHDAPTLVTVGGSSLSKANEGGKTLFLRQPSQADRVSEWKLNGSSALSLLARPDTADSTYLPIPGFHPRHSFEPKYDGIPRSACQCLRISILSCNLGGI